MQQSVLSRARTHLIAPFTHWDLRDLHACQSFNCPPENSKQQVKAFIHAMIKPVVLQAKVALAHQERVAANSEHAGAEQPGAWALSL